MPWRNLPWLLCTFIGVWWRFCQEHEDSQKQRLKERFKSNFQTRNNLRLCDSKTKTQEPITRTRDVQNKCENGSLLC
jgi:hypothetical protein